LSKFDIDQSVVNLALKRLLERAHELKQKRLPIHHVLDPYAAGLESIVFDYSWPTDWLEIERRRVNQKALMNYLGDFQQEIIGALPGWKSYSSGTGNSDVVGRRGSQKILGEIKNKYNTLNSASSKSTSRSLAMFLSQPEYANHIAVVATILAKPLKDRMWKEFAPGEDSPSRPDILLMSGRVFYAFACDPDERLPEINVKNNSNMSAWPSWFAIDAMAETVWSAMQEEAGYGVPQPIRDLVLKSFG